MTPGKNGYVAVAVRFGDVPRRAVMIDLESWSGDFADTNRAAWHWLHTIDRDLYVYVVETPITPSSRIQSPEGIDRVRGFLR